MKRLALFTVVSLLCLVSVQWQYELGVSVGSFGQAFHVKNSPGHDYLRLVRNAILPINVAVFYWEQLTKRVNLDLELVNLRRTFYTEFGYFGGVASSKTQGDMTMNTAYFVVAP